MPHADPVFTSQRIMSGRTRMYGTLRRMSPGITLVVLLLTVAARSPIRAVGRPAQSLGLSPEEAVIALKPYELTSSDLPSGYSAGAISTTTPTVDAVNQAATGADPYAA